MENSSLVDRILYRDAMMLIIDKPAGLAVHEGGQGGPSLRPMLDQLSFGLPRPPELAHRLDRDTSGCLVLGRHRKALADLGALFAEGKIKKTYWALTVGAPGEVGEEGLIDRPLKKIDQRRGKMAVAKQGDKAGQPSQTNWKVLGKSPDGRTAWIELSPLTGRTHQIRVHLASVGCPILGDRIYGVGTADLLAPQLCLHARAVSVPLYKNKPAVSVQAEPPEHSKRRPAAALLVVGAGLIFPFTRAGARRRDRGRWIREYGPCSTDQAALSLPRFFQFQGSKSSSRFMG